jgi:ribonuclease III
MPRRSAPSRTRSTTSTSTPRASEAPGPPPEVAAAALAGRLGLSFPSLRRLSEAVVHSCYPNEHPDEAIASNQRLEFLGDAAIQLVVSEALHARHPGDPEGQLTARRAAIVSTAGLAALARRLRLGDFLILGQGADRAGERRRPSVLAATMEAVAAAVYLDLGFDALRTWFLELAGPELGSTLSADSFVSPKSRLQELAYARHGHAPAYRVVSAVGPEHAKHYLVEAVLGGEAVGRGEGRNRREAETQAAEAALLALAERDPDRAVP